MKRKFLALVFSLGMTMSLASCGTQGPKGDQGIQGEPGKDGVSVKSITKTSSEGNVDTYTITYSDGSTSTFSVTNGLDGAPGIEGIQGQPGEDGHTPEIKIGSNGNWWIDGVDSGSTFSVTNGLDGAPGIEGIQGQPGEDGHTPEIKIGSNGNWWIDGVDSGISAKGEAGRSVTSIELTSSEGNIDTYTITYSDGTTSTFKVTNGQDGATGEQGIQGEPGKDGHTPTITIGENGNWFVDGKDTNIKAQGPEGPIGPQGPQGEQGPEGKPGQDGEDGRSIVSIKLTSSEGNIDTYTITYSDGTTSTFTITNGQNGATGEQGIQGEPGKDGHTPTITIGENGNWFVDGKDTNIKAQGPEGPIGPQGPQGEQGKPGNDGVSITKIEKTKTEGNVDTYTIFYSDGTTSNFTVTNGINGQDGATGEQGIQGEPGKDGETPVITIGSNGNWHINGKDSGVSAKAPNKNDQFTVRYYLNGGSMPKGVSTSISVYWGNTLALPIPTKQGYIFKGWFTGETANDKQFFKTDAVFTNLELYAKWEIGTYKVKLDLDGGTYNGSTELTYKYGDNYSLPINIYKKGFDFIGWTLNDEIIPNSGIYKYENITLKAKYEVATEFKIKLNLNGGTYDGTKEIVVRNNEPYTLPREGVINGEKVFVGWYNGAEKWNENGIYSLKENITLAAKWEDLETYNLTFDYNGGASNIGDAMSITNREIYDGTKSLPTPTKDGFELYGYSIGNYLITDSSKTLDFDTLRTVFGTNKDLTLTAKYIGVDDTHLGDYYRFGSYPQSKVKDTNTIDSLKVATDTDGDGYLNLGEDEYKEVNNYGNSKGFFKVEPIVWEVKADKTLVSSMILDSLNYNYTGDDRTIEGVQVHGNNYKYSTIRAFLNGYDGSEYQVANYANKGFIDLAFTEVEQAKIHETLVDNSVKSTGQTQNQYVCDDTNDKLFLLSYKELNKQENGYKTYTDRMRKGTDYAIANGLSVSSNNHSYYWTRSPNLGYSHYAYQVDRDGSVGNGSGVYDGNSGVLPALKIK